jgi:phosphatidylglycerophosphate synthase
MSRAPGDSETTGEGTYDRRWERTARRFLDAGVKPNHFTLLQIPVFMGLVWAALAGLPWWFFGLSWFVIILDGGDGILARVGNLQSRSGAILDAAMDTTGIAVVLWGASRFQPDWTVAFAALFVFNVVLYLQNGLLDEKVVSYVRGPIILAVTIPDVVAVAVAMTMLISAFLFAVRVPATVRALGGAQTS